MTEYEKSGAEIPEEMRGASRENLRWAPVLGDEELDRQVRKRVRALCERHPCSIIDRDDVAQRVRLRLCKAREKYPSLSPLDWRYMASAIIKRELARYAKRLERESRLRSLEISRDTSEAEAAAEDGQSWRGKLDRQRASEAFEAEKLKRDIVETIAAMEEPSRTVIKEYYDGKGIRTMAKERGRPFSSFQDREWAAAKKEFKRIFGFFPVVRR